MIPDSSFFHTPYPIHQNILSTLALRYIWNPTTFLHFIATILVHSTTISHLDYCNSVVMSIPAFCSCHPLLFSLQQPVIPLEYLGTLYILQWLYISLGVKANVFPMDYKELCIVSMTLFPSSSPLAHSTQQPSPYSFFMNLPVIFMPWSLCIFSSACLEYSRDTHMAPFFISSGFNCFPLRTSSLILLPWFDILHSIYDSQTDNFYLVILIIVSVFHWNVSLMRSGIFALCLLF